MWGGELMQMKMLFSDRNIWFNVIASNALNARLVAVCHERAFSKRSQSPNNLQGSKRWFKKRQVLCLHRVGLHFKAPKLVFYIKLEIYTHKLVIYIYYVHTAQTDRAAHTLSGTT